MPEIRTTSSTGGQKGVKLEAHDLIPQIPLKLLAEHFGRGAMKYATHQWRQGYEWSKSYSALQRHLSAFWAGKDYDVCSNDPEGCQHVDSEGKPFEVISPDTCYNHTGSHHLIAAAWHTFVLTEFYFCYPDHDDRYIPLVKQRNDDGVSGREAGQEAGQEAGREAGVGTTQSFGNYPKVTFSPCGHCSVPYDLCMEVVKATDHGCCDHCIHQEVGTFNDSC